MKNKEIIKLLNEICDLIAMNLQNILALRYDISIKKDGTPVTKSDLLLESIVLSYIEERIPNAIFISEESYNTIKDKEVASSYLILLDPIDGTENFCSGLVEWGVSLGVWQGTTHIGSLLFFPEMGIRLVTGDRIKPIQSRIIGLSSSMADSVIEKLREVGEYRIMGCAAYNIYNVIRGAFGRFINPKGAYVWDLLPGIMLALEHGCSVKVNEKEFAGEFLDPSKLYRVEIQR